MFQLSYFHGDREWVSIGLVPSYRAAGRFKWNSYQRSNIVVPEVMVSVFGPGLQVPEVLRDCEIM